MSDYFSQIKLHKLPLTLMIPIEAIEGAIGEGVNFAFKQRI